MKWLFWPACLFPLFVCLARPVGAIGAPAAGARPNVLLITVDDMSAASIGAFGCGLPDTTPNIDRLARRGVRFHRAHVVVGNCMPSRNVMWSGLYPHNSRVEGFYEVPDAKYPHLVDLMKGAGYFTGIRGKVTHSTPYSPYAWDIVLETLPDGSQAHPKNVKSYGISTAEGIRLAKAAGKPFCLMVNISDPHKPFYAEGKRGETISDPNVPSRVFRPEEVPVPGFLFDDPVVRKELSHYYSSVRRADDCAGEILAALRAAGEEDDTLIVFLSDHGMPLPFSKTQVYHDSTRTPLFFVWPGVLPEGREDDAHLVSTVDLLPTLLEMLGIVHPGKMDGRSFAALLNGGDAADRDWVIKEYNENSGGVRNPMRAIQTTRDLYIFNPWSNGQRTMSTATLGTPTYRRMAELAKTDSVMAARHDLFLHRVPEEIYDVALDADCLRNVVGEKSHQGRLDGCRSRLEAWMVGADDPMLETFRNRTDPVAREAFMSDQAGEAAARKGGKGKGKGKKRAGQNTAAGLRGAKGKALISFELPGDAEAGRPVTVGIRHDLPEDMGERAITVTMKAGDERLGRKTVRARGSGTAQVVFDVPAGVDGVVNFAAFVGEDYRSTPQHITSDPLPVREASP
ncbi:MAG: sulfatase [Verrucomicrobiae bacterium]|nr:sulfatase [Verrucomicrobiae bacterium]